MPWEVRMCGGEIYGHQRLTMAMTTVCNEFEDFGIAVSWDSVTEYWKPFYLSGVVAFVALTVLAECRTVVVH